MIIGLLLQFALDFAAQLASYLPQVGVQDIPLFGSYIYTYFSYAVQYMNSVTEIVPFTEIVWHSFVYIILPFEFSLLFLKLILGNRLPVNV